jgi:hypothetical protein
MVAAILVRFERHGGLPRVEIAVHHADGDVPRQPGAFVHQAGTDVVLSPHGDFPVVTE